MITYLGGYLQQDKASSDGLIELKAGLKLVQKSFTSISSKAAYTDDEKYTLYGMFDGLNFLFGLADFKALQSIVNEELYQGLLQICTLDKNELQLFANAETSNEFYQLQSGSNRKHYKEFAYAFIGDIIKHPEATQDFLLFCVKTFKENMHQADGDLAKASAALFILALCDKTNLEANKAHVATFIKSELLDIITEDQSADKLVRFRAVWIVETFAMFLEKEDQKRVMMFYGKILTADPEAQ